MNTDSRKILTTVAYISWAFCIISAVTDYKDIWVVGLFMSLAVAFLASIIPETSRLDALVAAFNEHKVKTSGSIEVLRGMVNDLEATADEAKTAAEEAKKNASNASLAAFARR